ncbi:MAG TPA: phosphodiester glycosidase family protein [Solirubrobacteraceae bacterium]|nr:phosphodiester glycosidase family protein [Solirubrobacteraceae bacterium]
MPSAQHARTLPSSADEGLDLTRIRPARPAARPVRSPTQPARPAQRSPRPRRHVAAARRFRVRRILALVLALSTLQVLVSLIGALTAPSNTPASVQFVEWLRNNGSAGLVSGIENVYYSLTAPATGGAALKHLPHVGAGSAAAMARGSYRPANIAPVISPALPGEGVWQGTGLTVNGAPPVLVTTYRPDPNYPQMVAGVAWIDRTRTSVELYPGRYEPANSGNVPAEVPPADRGALVATFNSGFKLEDDHGGFVANGHSYAPLAQGQATFIRYRNGSYDIRTWAGGPLPGPNIVFARQNLPLIVENGRLNPQLSNGALWGATLGNAVRVWRSGVGIDARGDLIYASADLQTAQSLAQILQHAGAVRAMELDINYEWTTFNFYGGWGAAQPHKLLPLMSRPATRYLSPDDRDFFAVYARR